MNNTKQDPSSPDRGNAGQNNNLEPKRAGDSPAAKQARGNSTRNDGGRPKYKEYSKASPKNRALERSKDRLKNTVKNTQKNKSNPNNREIYDIFGAKIRKKVRNSGYRPEYLEIQLPQPPQSLWCGICNQAIRGKTELLEALEIQPGEFSVPKGPDVGESTAAHFLCVLQVLVQYAQLEDGESVAYLGGGKFAVVQGPRRIVKRMMERNQWRQNSSLSPTNWSAWRQNMSSHTLVAALSIETDVR